ncbi:hypothetical protein SAMN04515671_4548 [Nakamurella panacisegetis]|uniref:Uncharacterized protein n=1 Tax=Nakamurella panacisegetis TaxID=1090615 RepID=A0A1H0TB03_9ACTN|nr:hypothetical protein SAMN04515671_4548 [Nakamurella panacisegetis]
MQRPYRPVDHQPVLLTICADTQHGRPAEISQRCGRGVGLLQKFLIQWRGHAPRPTQPAGSQLHPVGPRHRPGTAGSDAKKRTKPLLLSPDGQPRRSSASARVKQGWPRPATPTNPPHPRPHRKQDSRWQRPAGTDQPPTSPMTWTTGTQDEENAPTEPDTDSRITIIRTAVCPCTSRRRHPNDNEHRTGLPGMSCSDHLSYGTGATYGRVRFPLRAARSMIQIGHPHTSGIPRLRG